MAADPASGRLARAKVNLSLHLCGQRADGYHLLDSLVVFPETGDRLSAMPAAEVSLAVSGPFAEGLSTGEDNLIIRAARALAAQHGIGEGAALTLEKNLPVASGIGGGSSNAATALVLLEDLWSCRADGELALSLGADVPVCRAAPVAQRMRGIGERLDAVPGLPPCWVVLVNPRAAVPTGAVFAGVADRNPPAAPGLPATGFRGFDDFALWLGMQRNDLQAAAIAVCPVIAEVLDALSTAPVSRMSGSGATCFALHPDESAARRQAEDISARTSWWTAVAPV